MSSTPGERHSVFEARGLPASSDERTRLTSAALFVLLLIAAVSWPLPLRPILPLESTWFLGREPLMLDAAFCVLALLYAWRLTNGRWRALLRLPELVLEELAALRDRAAKKARTARFGVIAFAGMIAVAAVWLVADAAVVEGVRQSGPWVRRLAIPFNRMSGGANPPMVVLFFLLAGAALGYRRWLRTGVELMISTVAAGAFVQLVKVIVGRARPESGGPFDFTGGHSSAFPSGHTAGAAAILAVLAMNTRSTVLRAVLVAGMLLVGAARVVSMRHWPSDVVAAIIIASLVAWLCSSGGGEANGER